MTIYGYQCRECGQGYTSEFRGDVLMVVSDDPELDGMFAECHCGNGSIKRKYSISTTAMMHEHMNASTGSLISSPSQFRRELREMSDRETERTGIPCSYEPIDPEEARAQVVASDGVGLDATNRVRVNEGQPPIRL